MITPPTDLTLAPLAPALTLLITGAVALLVGVVRRDGRIGGVLALAGLAVAAVFAGLNLASARAEPASAFGLQWLLDPPSAALALVVLVGTFLAVLIGWDALAPAGMDHPEYYPLLLFAATGAMVMVHAGDFVVLLLGLEILSLSVYALSAWRTADRQSEEAGMKYFLLGAFASAVLTYGIALVYGATGAFGYAGVAAAMADGTGVLGLLGGALVLAGLGFKVSFAPFHQWAPDVYTGAPTPVTAFMSVVVKAAAFGALVRVFATAWPDAMPALDTMLAVLVALTLLVGNFGALLQSGVKRMLAYSAVAHAGYLGLAVLAAGAGTLAQEAIAWYLAAYTVMNAGAFAVLSQVAGNDPRGDRFPAYARPDRGLGGPGTPPARTGGRHDAVPAQPGGHPAAGRLRRQAAGGPGGARDRLDRPGGAGADHRGGGGRVLHAGGDGHVVRRRWRGRSRPLGARRLGDRPGRGRHGGAGAVPEPVVRAAGRRTDGDRGRALSRPSPRSLLRGRAPPCVAPAPDAMLRSCPPTCTACRSW